MLYEASDIELILVAEAIPRRVRERLAAARQKAREQIERAVARSDELTGAAGDRIRAEIAAQAGDVFQLGRVIESLIRLVGDQTQALGRALSGLLSAEQDAAVELAADFVDDPLEAAGTDLALSQPTLPLLQTLKDFSADLITNITADVRTRINQEIRLLTLGNRSVTDAMDTIRRLLPPVRERRRTGAAARSEAIVRTEVGRVQSAASDHRLQQASRSVPGMRKQWIHSGNVINPRDGHRAYSGTHVPVDEPFMVAPVIGAPREALRYPRDPLASARSTVNCRCTHVAFLPQWDSS